MVFWIILLKTLNILKQNLSKNIISSYNYVQNVLNCILFKNIINIILKQNEWKK